MALHQGRALRAKPFASYFSPFGAGYLQRASGRDENMQKADNVFRLRRPGAAFGQRACERVDPEVSARRRRHFQERFHVRRGRTPKSARSGVSASGLPEPVRGMAVPATAHQGRPPRSRLPLTWELRLRGQPLSRNSFGAGFSPSRSCCLKGKADRTRAVAGSGLLSNEHV